MIRSILAVAQGGPDADMAYRMAASLATEFGAAVDALHFPVNDDDAAGGLAMASMTMALPEMAGGIDDERTRRAMQAFVAHLKAIPDAAFEAVERDPEILVRRGRTSDLLVIGRPGGDPQNEEPEIVETVLYECSRPVLIAPPEGGSGTPASAVVAWNGSAQAARAVYFALPLLRRSKQVAVVVGAGDPEEVGAPRLKRYLERHGVAARIESLDPGSVSARSRGRALLEFTHSSKAGLLVMGAYGRGEIERFLGLGGATGKVISACRVPLLMSS